MKTRFQIGGAQALGRAGVFWAWGHVGGDERIAFSCWAVNVGRAHEIEPFGVAIEQLDIGPSGGRHEVLDTNQIYAIPCKEPPTAVYEIEVRVNAVEVKQITVNGDDLLTLPIPLHAELGRDWRKLRNTDYGFMGQRPCRDATVRVHPIESLESKLLQRQPGTESRQG